MFINMSRDRNWQVAIDCNRLQKLSGLRGFGVPATVKLVADRRDAGLCAHSLPPGPPSVVKVIKLDLRGEGLMTKSIGRFSAAAAFAIFIFMGFTTGALGQGAVSGKIQSGSLVVSQTAISQTSMSQASAGLLLLALEPGRGQGRRGPAPSPAPGPGGGCGNKNGGWDQHGGGGCSAVPEGGTTFGYLALVGLCCVAAAIFSIRRQARVSATK
jgi:hypothetical protein